MAHVVTATSALQLVGLSALPARRVKLTSTGRHGVVCYCGDSSASLRRAGGGGARGGRTRTGQPEQAVSSSSSSVCEGGELSWRRQAGRGTRGRRAVEAKASVNEGGEEGGAVDVLLQESGGEEVVFFDGGPHYGDLALNLVLGLTLVWLPLTVAAIARRLVLKYRLTDRRVSVVSGLTGGEQRDFSYASVVDVVSVPRFIGEWGDIVLTLDDKTKIEMKSVPRFREVANYCKQRSAEEREAKKAKAEKKSSSAGTMGGPALGEKPRGFSS
ncbi:hypothetical protein CBR_g47945 [Chara braunii]|uniref:YdbS-like PH domain-containing protein n=1 Tax=Chara braunii TaxID=69332 RepID=A0A388M1U3_CHABU|nr:hypothetical protein CBR_g47945 [Chara braunii]|eukprot:GBG88475.1 hypothetical protein CBR_g47945 [Chara braunii]